MPMTDQMPSPPSIEISDSQYQKLGLQCISPGIATANLDDERLQTFNKSKYIAMQQKRQIRRMNLDSVTINEDEHEHEHEQENEQDEEQDDEKEHEKEHEQDEDQEQEQDDENTKLAEKAGTSIKNNNNITASDLETDKSSSSNSIDGTTTPGTETSINTSKSQSKSLKRNNIPKPLTLKSKQNTPNGSLPNIRSAPPMVTRHPIPSSHTFSQRTSRVSKPRVIYKGRSLTRNLAGQIPMFQTSSPIVPRPLMRHQYAPMTAYPTTTAPPHTQRSFEQFVSNPIRATNSVTRDVFKDETTRIAPLSVQPKSTKREFFDAIEIEDHSNNVVIEGDIQLMMENFQFHFDSTDPQMDKKLFLSICSKIWDDVVSRE
ncbi:Dig1p [Kluyveromyces lactis]|uniref:KLLA0D11572p n=1 Tax=Kluyveromyces lactis (strain ATCC 8585 / CBS 2359 / DSM 70799 / NBRC 1267 / NRRL Y-1140 / WM37) TaxID=284590 RepID=Q6CR62_KLULA|nr:uncharacterized protein KLLA0_D11572g [Kluyveromyces lactis]CAH00673.1 KLLA0D11572p [Kluyveromyces lactis]|eukprot:XP_453577.1 uncharacterized protein KLLA0_D11572g [Kluyveromyces lactis]